MAAPAATTRVQPTGKKLENGKTCKVTFSLDTNLNVWEIAVTPVGWDGGEPINISDQWNTRYQTKAFRALIEGTDGQFTFHYDPVCRNELVAMINIPQTITFLYPDGSTDAYYGAIRSVSFDAMEDGTDPKGTLTFTPSQYDTTNDVEAAPVLVEVAGT